MTAVSFSVPKGACDCHIHAYDEAYPLAPTATFNPPHAPMNDYAQVQATTLERMSYSQQLPSTARRSSLLMFCTLVPS